jgi:uncharacterized protein DUF3300
MKSLARYAVLVAALLAPALGLAQTRERAAFSQAELDQMLAPVALYPDPLLSQMLMAATYPLEVVEATRWSKAHPGLQGDAAVKAAAGEGWDPSVTSLVAFPQVLAWMDENLKWTSAVGDAFLAQQPQVMDTVQSLRARAQDAGNLRSDDRVVVTQEGPTIVVVPADPQVVYVPYYDPFVVYGTWWWPAYPPVYWRPWTGYVVRPGFVVVWTPGIRVTAGFFFGACDWQRRQVRVVQVNNYYYNRTVIVNRQVTVNRTPGVWQHDPWHRRGIGYRDAALQRRYAAPAERERSRAPGSVAAPREPSRAPAQVEAPRGYSPPPRVREERRGEERRGEFRSERGNEERRGEERRSRRQDEGRSEERREQAFPRESAPHLPGALPPLPGGLPPPQQQRRDSGAGLNDMRVLQREHARAAEYRPRVEARREFEARPVARPAPSPALRAREHGGPHPAEAAPRRHGERQPA